MVNPVTVNVGIIVPLTGADVDLWGALDVNPNMVAIDGLFAGVATIGVTNAPVTLTVPAGFVATPSAGPTQSQNRVLRFTGAMTGNVRVTLPMPGSYLLENRTSGNFVLSFQGATATEVVAIGRGMTQEVYNDGANVRFVNMGMPGKMEFWSGLAGVMPAWVTACTVPPYVLADATILNFSDFPFLGAWEGGTFGGNGVTTFGVPDCRGRVPLMYDGTGTRITSAGSGINGQLLNSSADNQSVTLNSTQMPSHFHAVGIYDPTHSHSQTIGSGNGSGGGGAFGVISPTGGTTTTGFAATGVRANSSNGLDTTGSTGGGGAHSNVQPSIMAGIWVVKT